MSDFFADQFLANEGKARCRICEKVFPFGDVIAVVHKDTLVFAICVDCTGGQDIVIKRGPGGLHIRGESHKLAVSRAG